MDEVEALLRALGVDAWRGEDGWLAEVHADERAAVAAAWRDAGSAFASAHRLTDGRHVVVRAARTADGRWIGARSERATEIARARFEHELRGLLAAIRIAVEAFAGVELPPAYRALLAALADTTRGLETIELPR